MSLERKRVLSVVFAIAGFLMIMFSYDLKPVMIKGGLSVGITIFISDVLFLIGLIVSFKSITWLGVINFKLKLARGIHDLNLGQRSYGYYTAEISVRCEQGKVKDVFLSDSSSSKFIPDTSTK